MDSYLIKKSETVNFLNEKRNLNAEREKRAYWYLSNLSKYSEQPLNVLFLKIQLETLSEAIFETAVDTLNIKK